MSSFGSIAYSEFKGSLWFPKAKLASLTTQAWVDAGPKQIPKAGLMLLCSQKV
jgi:hypothetical protein